jgi:putative flippase GtrA
MNPGLRRSVREMFAFGMVGVINTLVGYAVIYTCMLALGMGAVASNVAGYAVGLCCSFVLNRRLTFRSDGSARAEVLRFIATFLVAYTINLLILLLCIERLGVPPVYAQVVAGVGYTAVFFVLSKWFVFRPRSRELTGHDLP